MGNFGHLTDEAHAPRGFGSFTFPREAGDGLSRNAEPRSMSVVGVLADEWSEPSDHWADSLVNSKQRLAVHLGPDRDGESGVAGGGVCDARPRHRSSRRIGSGGLTSAHHSRSRRTPLSVPHL
jgi:hypothetical protein